MPIGSWLVFETPESAIELLWDIALAFFIVRTAFVYFLIGFIGSTALSYLAFTRSPASGYWATPQSVGLISLHLAFLVFYARCIIVYYEIPRHVTFRLAIGVVAMSFMVAAEALTAFVLYEEGLGDWILVAGLDASSELCARLAAFALIPAALILLEGRREVWPDTTPERKEEKSAAGAT